MRKTIYISCLLKDNMIIDYSISSNLKEYPHDYYKSFIYSETDMENCDDIYTVKWCSVEFEEEDDKRSDFNNYIFMKVAERFYKNWKIHPEHWGSPAYEEE